VRQVYRYLERYALARKANKSEDAAELEELNKNIVGLIEVIGEYRT
jgi:hypothetical protein